jgi:hypothetical protein
MGGATCKTCRLLIQLEIESLGAESAFDSDAVFVEHDTDHGQAANR